MASSTVLLAALAVALLQQSSAYQDITGRSYLRSAPEPVSVDFWTKLIKLVKDAYETSLKEELEKEHRQVQSPPEPVPRFAYQSPPRAPAGPPAPHLAAPIGPPAAPLGGISLREAFRFINDGVAAVDGGAGLGSDTSLEKLQESAVHAKPVALSAPISFSPVAGSSVRCACDKNGLRCGCGHIVNCADLRSDDLYCIGGVIRGHKIKKTQR